MLDYQQKTHRRNDALFVLNTCISLDYCIIPTRYLLGRRVVSFHVLCGVPRTHSTSHAAERPSAFGRSGLRLGWFCCHTSLNCTGTFYIINRAGHKTDLVLIYTLNPSVFISYTPLNMPYSTICFIYQNELVHIIGRI